MLANETTYDTEVTFRVRELTFVLDWTCFRSDFASALPFFAVITSPDKSPKCTDSTTNVYASTAMPTFGSISRWVWHSFTLNVYHLKTPIFISTGLVWLLALDRIGRQPNFLSSRRFESEYRHSGPYPSSGSPPRGSPRGKKWVLVDGRKSTRSSIEFIKEELWFCYLDGIGFAQPTLLVVPSLAFPQRSSEFPLSLGTNLANICCFNIYTN